MKKILEKFTKKQLIIATIIFVALIVTTLLSFKYKDELVNLMNSPAGTSILFVWSFVESSFFPVPPDPALIALVSGRPDQWVILALITTVASVLGAMFGYWIGKKYGHDVLLKFVSQEKVDKAEAIFNKYSAVSLLIAGITPVPFKVFTILSGVLEMNRTKFIIFSFIGRAFRFFLVAYITSEAVSNPWLKNNSESIFIGIGIILALGALAYYLYDRSKKKKNK
jgi:membrane protein YqaA with SNARE-associated domain